MAMEYVSTMAMSKKTTPPAWAKAAAKHVGMTAKAFWSAHQAGPIPAAKGLELRWAPWSGTEYPTRTPEEQAWDSWQAVVLRLQQLGDPERQNRYREAFNAGVHSLVAELSNLLVQTTSLAVHTQLPASAPAPVEQPPTIRQQANEIKAAALRLAERQSSMRVSHTDVDGLPVCR